MRKLSVLLALVIVVALAVPPLLACLWDYDTLAMERKRFPDALELITGKFLRHSEEFYRWRIEDRKKRIAADPDNVRLRDDLAVAYDKVGEHDLAIKTMQEQLAQYPDRYETLANLGTFYIHSGDFEKGVEFIGRAIEINSDAHFGREVYQKLLVEYVMKQGTEAPDSLPLNDVEANLEGERVGFGQFVLVAAGFPEEKDSGTPALPGAGRVELKKAIKGVLGMMRFGQHDSPVLLEALGDLLMALGFEQDAKRLASRAYLKASYETEGKSSNAYRWKAECALGNQSPTGASESMPLNHLETMFAVELKEAKSWATAVRADELAWIDAGVDVDAAFSRKYYDEPQIHEQAPPLPPEDVTYGFTHEGGLRSEWWASIAGIVAILILLGAALRYGYLKIIRPSLTSARGSSISR